MALPSSGPISFANINTELGRSSTAQLGINEAEAGSYGAINTNSTSRPNGTTPNGMDEWYGYDHTADSYTTVDISNTCNSFGCTTATNSRIYFNNADYAAFVANGYVFGGIGGGAPTTCTAIARDVSGNSIASRRHFEYNTSVCWIITNGSFSYASPQC